MANQSIFIILNQMSKVNEEARLDCVNQLQKELLDITQFDSINKVVKISQENIFPLGQAFNSSNFGPGNKKTVFSCN